MAFFSRDKTPPIKPDPVVNDFGFIDPKAKPYHCGCGHEENTSSAMDTHVRKEHSND